MILSGCGPRSKISPRTWMRSSRTWRMVWERWVISRSEMISSSKIGLGTGSPESRRLMVSLNSGRKISLLL